MKKYNVIPLVFAVVLFISLFRLGSVLLFDVDEAVFSEATKEMVQSGDYITTTYNGVVRYDKPVLFYWAMAVSYKIFGINEFGARFPSALAGCLLAAALYYFVRHFLGQQKAIYSVLSLVLSSYYLVYSRSAVTDMLLALFISLSLFCFYLAVRNDGRFIYGFYSFSALAFLTKGLIGIVFPGAIAFIFLILTEGASGVRKLINVKGIILFLLIGVPWYAAEYAVRGYEFIDQFFVKHHFKRYTEVISGHKGPVYYYVAALVIGLFPWVAFLPAGVKKIFREKDPLMIFSGIWLSFIIVFFSFATTKLPDYILSGIPAACILIASGMTEEGAGWRRFATGFIGAVSAAAGVAFIVLPSYLAQKGITAAGWMPITGSIALVMAVVCFYSTFTAKPLFSAMFAGMLIFLTILVVKALPMASDYLQGSLYKYSLYGKEKLRPDEHIVTLGLNKPSVVFYSDRRVTIAGSTEALQAMILEGKAKLVLTKTKDAEKVKKMGLTLHDQSHDYVLFEKH